MNEQNTTNTDNAVLSNGVVDSKENLFKSNIVMPFQEDLGAFRQGIVNQMAKQQPTGIQTLVGSQQLANPINMAINIYNLDNPVDNSWDSADILTNPKYKDLNSSQKLYLLDHANSAQGVENIMKRWEEVTKWNEAADNDLGISLRVAAVLAGAFSFTPTGLTPGIVAGASTFGFTKVASAVAGSTSSLLGRAGIGISEGIVYAASDAANAQRKLTGNELGLQALLGGVFNSVFGRVRYVDTPTGVNIVDSGAVVRGPAAVSYLEEAESLVATNNVVNTVVANSSETSVGNLLASLDDQLGKISQGKAAIETEMKTVDDTLKILDEQITAAKSSVKAVDDEVNLAAKEYESKLTEYLANPNIPENFRRVFGKKLSSIFADVVGPGVKTAKAADEVIEEVGIDTLKASAKQYDEATKGTISKLNKLLPEEAKAAGVDVSTLTTKKAIRELFQDAAKATKKSANALIDELAVAQRASKVAKEGLSKADEIAAAKAVERKQLDTLKAQREELVAKKSKLTENLNGAAKAEDEVMKVKAMNAGKAVDDVADSSIRKATAYKTGFMNRLAATERALGVSPVGKTLAERIAAIVDDYSPYPNMFLDDLEDVRRAAAFTEDTDLLTIVNHPKMPETTRALGTLTGESLRAASKDVAKGKYLSSYDTVLQTLADRLLSIDNKAIRYVMSKLVSGTRATEDGSVVINGADYHKERYFQQFRTRLQEVRAKHTEAYMKNRGKYMPKVFYMSHGDIKTFMNRAGDLLHKIDNAPLIVSQYEPEVVAYVKEVQGIVADMRKEAIRLGVAEHTAADLTKAALSRVPRFDVYIEGIRRFGKDKVIEVFHGAIVKAQPNINKTFKLKALEKELAAKPGDAAIEAQIKTLKTAMDEVSAKGALTDTDVIEIIRADKASGDSYSEMLASLYVNRQYDRALNRAPISKSNVVANDIIDMLNDASPDYLSRLSPEERSKFEALLANSKKGSEGAVDFNMSRIDMDFTFEAKLGVVGEEGSFNTVSGVDFLEKNVEDLTRNYINKMSGTLGLAKVGVRSPEEFDNLIAAMKDNLGDVTNVGQRERFNSDIETLKKYFEGTPQIDTSGVLHSINRVLKSLVASKTLSYLALSMNQEAGNIVAQQGLKSVIRQFPQSMKGLIKLASEGGGMSRTLSWGGTDTITLFDDYMRNAANINEYTGAAEGAGVATWGGVGATNVSSRRAYLQATDNLAANIGQATSMLYKPVDSLIRRLSVSATLDNLMNATDEVLKGPRYKANGISDSTIKFREILKTYAKRDADGFIIDVDMRAAREVYPEEADDFIVSVIRIADRAVQTNRVTQMPPFVNSELFALLGQFKAWSLGTYNNQLMYNLSVGDSVTALTFSTQLATGYLTALARASINAKVTGDDKQLRGLTENVSYASLAALRNTGFAAIPGMVIGSIAQSATGVDVINQSSITGQGAFEPLTYKLGKDLLHATQGLLTDTFTGQMNQHTIAEFMKATLPKVLADSGTWALKKTNLPTKKPEGAFDLGDSLKIEQNW